MHLDISRDSFDPLAQISRVLQLQGRVLVDAEWNEQNLVVQQFLRGLAADLIGWHAGPGVDHNVNGPRAGAFAVRCSENAQDVDAIYFAPQAAGRYYIDGVSFLHQQAEQTLSIRLAAPASPALLNRLVYVELWEREITGLVNAGLADPALDGAESAARTVIRCRAWSRPTDIAADHELLGERVRFLNYVDPTRRTAATLPRLIARLAPAGAAATDCAERLAARYQGPQNQLYRVEVHRGSAPAGAADSAITFKWSRDNGCALFAVAPLTVSPDGANPIEFHLNNWWSERRFALSQGDYLELLDADLQGLAGQDGAAPLVVVTALDPRRRSIQVKPCAPLPSGLDVSYLRRWDQQESSRRPLDQGALPVAKWGTISNAGQFEPNEEAWITLEDGVQVQFALPTHGRLLTGDYWLIPARASISDILWPAPPVGSSGPGPGVPARFMSRYLAPIAHVAPAAGAAHIRITDLRKSINEAAADSPLV